MEVSIGRDLEFHLESLSTDVNGAFEKENEEDQPRSGSATCKRTSPSPDQEQGLDADGAVPRWQAAVEDIAVACMDKACA
eukprot:CAMPEP_0172198860 /NCGR_PEP_ID=MMETSP1050-20130122/28341_1 /TAXON_ID=233186 /ORGANISM="Cryptomonas curvata, Strain CCAP979/52" /LENGTH=79 /DNA_ID=CAMNT_0012875767 /DNA_START=38 /DNA_END=274 /DNA_ORIENTATION=-